MVVWDIHSSENSVFMVISWSIIVYLIVVIIKLWVSLMLDMVFNVWLLVVDPGHNRSVMGTVVVSILMMNIMMILVDKVVVIVMVIVVVLINVVVDWLVDNFVVDFVMDWLVVYWLVVDIVVNLMVDIMVHWLVYHMVIVVWGLMVIVMMINMVVVMMVVMVVVMMIVVRVVVVHIMDSGWLIVLFVSSPFCVVVDWVDIGVVSGDMVIIMSPCIVVVVMTVVDLPSGNLMVIVVVMMTEMIVLVVREVVVWGFIMDFMVGIVMRSVVHVLRNILVVIVVGWDVLVVINKVASVDVMAHGMVWSCEIMVIEMSIVMVIMVVMVVVVLDNMVLWCVVRIDVGIVVLNSVWVIEVVVSMVSTIGDNMMIVVVNWCMVHWFVMDWSMGINVVWSNMGINVMWCSMSNSMNWNSSMWSIMVWGWVSNNMWGSMNIMNWGVSGVNWGMNIMGSSKMGVDSISVLMVCSMTTVVLWV